jgi:hypothetical protein
MGLETTAALRAVFLGSSLRRLHGQPQLQAVRPAVYLFITPLEVNVLNSALWYRGRPGYPELPAAKPAS